MFRIPIKLMCLLLGFVLMAPGVTFGQVSTQGHSFCQTCVTCCGDALAYGSFDCQCAPLLGTCIENGNCSVSLLSPDGSVLDELAPVDATAIALASAMDEPPASENPRELRRRSCDGAIVARQYDPEYADSMKRQTQHITL